MEDAEFVDHTDPRLFRLSCSLTLGYCGGGWDGGDTKFSIKSRI